MRAILTCLLVLLALTAFFAGVTAIGIFALHWKNVAVTSHPIPTPKEADRDEEDEATPASASLPPSSAAPRPIEPPAPAPAPPAARPPPAPPPAFHADPRPAQPQVIDLSPIRATVHGRMIRVEAVPGGYAVVGWSDPEAYVEWPLDQQAPGRYRVELTFACDDQSGGEFEVIAADQALNGRARSTGGADRFQTMALGTVQLPADGARVVLKAGWRVRGALMNLKSVRLVPTP